MKAVAAVVILVGLTMMSAPLVLPQLGISLPVPAPKAAVAQPGESGAEGGIAGFGAMVTQSVGSVVAFFGAAPNGGGSSPDAVAAEFDAVCGALSGERNCTHGSDADFAATFGRAAGGIVSGDMPAEALAAPPGAPPPSGTGAAGRVPGVSIIATSVRPGASGGAKFVKVPVPKADVEGDVP